jgi:hypothetical protein
MPILSCLNRGGYFNLCYPDPEVGGLCIPSRRNSLMARIRSQNEEEGKGPVMYMGGIKTMFDFCLEIPTSFNEH